MALNILPSTNPKRRRIMIITADEDIIDQLEKTNDASLLTQIMLESEAGNSKRSDQQVQVSEPKIRTNHESLTCVVCGSPAHGHNFGAITCESCKAFFRRSALKPPNIYQCRIKRNCEITPETRRNCPACRLAKCFKCGMQRNRLSTNEQKAAKHRRIAENRTLTLNSISKINEQQFQSSSSIVSLDSPLSIDPDILLLTDFSDLLPSEPEQVIFSPDDLQRVENISFLYQKRAELATADGLGCNPPTHTKKYLEILNNNSVSVMRLLSFFKQIPEFNQLNVDDKVTLIKYNLTTVLSISSALLYNKETRQIIEPDSDTPVDYHFFQVVYGYDICRQAKKAFDSLLYLANYDRKIVEISLIIFILTKGFSTTDIREPILKDIMAVYRAQNCYIELLWKYMEAIHGPELAVRLYSQLILHTLSWQTIQDDMRHSIMRILSPDDIDEILPIMKSILLIS